MYLSNSSRIVLTVLLITAFGPAQAQKFGKLPQLAGKTTRATARASKTMSPAMQQALQHAQALRELQAGKALEKYSVSLPQNTLEQIGQIPPAPQLQQVNPSLQTSDLNARVQATVEQKIDEHDRLEQLADRIMDLQQQSIATSQEPIWRKNLAFLPARKTPHMWLSLLQDYVLQYRKFPANGGDSKPLYDAYFKIIHELPSNSSVCRTMRRLRREYPPQTRQRTSPQQKLYELKAFEKKYHRFPKRASQDPTEKALYVGIYNVYRQLGMEHPISKQLRKIQGKYAHSHKSPQEWTDEFELFVTLHDRLPSQNSDDLGERELWAGIHNVLKHLNSRDPLAVHIRKIWQPYKPVRVSPQEWADRLEAFTFQNNRLPQPNPNDPQEQALYKGVYNALKRLPPDDPVAVHIRNLQHSYNKTPEQLLEQLEEFVEKHDYFPTSSVMDEQELKLYRDVLKTLQELPAEDPFCLRIRQLQRRYSH